MIEQRVPITAYVAQTQLIVDINKLRAQFDRQMAKQRFLHFIAVFFLVGMVREACLREFTHVFMGQVVCLEVVNMLSSRLRHNTEKTLIMLTTLKNRLLGINDLTQ